MQTEPEWNEKTHAENLEVKKSMLNNIKLEEFSCEIPLRYLGTIKDIKSAINGTFVFLLQCKCPRSLTHSFQHYWSTVVTLNPKNQQQVHYDFKYTVKQIIMPNQNEVIVIDAEKHTLCIIDVVQKSMIRHNNPFFRFLSESTKIFYFCQTDLLLLVKDIQTVEEYSFVLYYFDYTQFKNKKYNIKQKKHLVYQKLSANHSVYQLDNRSKIGWASQRELNKIQFYTYQIGFNKNQGETTFQFPIDNIKKVDHNVYVQITKITMLNQKEYFLQLKIEKIKKPHLAISYHNVIVNQNTGQSHLLQQRIKKMPFPLFGSSTRIVKFAIFNKFSLLFIKTLQICKVRSKFILFIDNCDFSILKIQQYQFQNDVQASSSIFQPQTITSWFTYKATLYLSKRTLINFGQFYLAALLKMNEDFDDDLLQDALELLKEQNYSD